MRLNALDHSFSHQELELRLRQRRFQLLIFLLQFFEFVFFVFHFDPNNFVDEVTFAKLSQPFVNRTAATNIVNSSDL